MSSRRKKRKTVAKKSFFHKYSSKLTNLLLKLIVVLISLGALAYIVYKAYTYTIRPVDVKNIPVVQNTHQCVKKKFTGNDGLIFSNQDKIVYNEMILKDKNKNKQSIEKKSEEVSQDFSHQQIFDIVKDIKNSQDTPANQQDVPLNTATPPAHKQIFDIVEDAENS